MALTFSKNCAECLVSLVKGETMNFYEIKLSKKAVGKKVTVTISPK